MLINHTIARAFGFSIKLFGEEGALREPVMLCLDFLCWELSLIDSVSVLSKNFEREVLIGPLCVDGWSKEGAEEKEEVIGLAGADD